MERTERFGAVAVALGGGAKSSQVSDIAGAREMVAILKE